MGRRSSIQTTRGDATLRDALVISHSTVNRQTTGGRAKTGGRRTWLRAGTCRRMNRAGPRPRLCAVGWQDSRQRHGPLGCPKRTPPNPSRAPADAALATRASSRAPAVRHLMMSINFSTAAGGPEMMRLFWWGSTVKPTNRVGPPGHPAPLRDEGGMVPLGLGEGAHAVGEGQEGRGVWSFDMLPQARSRTRRDLRS